MRKIIFFNLSVVILWLISFGLNIINFPYLIYFFGILIFFLPGLNLTWVLEQITKQKQGMAKLVLWAFLSSFSITLGLIYFVSSYFKVLGMYTPTIIIFFSWWFLTLVMFIVGYSFRKMKPTEFLFSKIKNHKIFWLALLVWLIILTINFLLYRFIPSADGYGYLMRVSSAIQNNFISEGSRALFYVFSWSFFYLSHIPFYWIYKIIVPSFSVILVLFFYQYSRSISKNKLVILAGSLVFVSCIFFVMENFIPRPQSFFMLFLLPMLFFAADLLKNCKFNQLPWFLYLLAIAAFSVRMHQFFIILFVIILIAFIVFCWPIIKKHPLSSILLTVLISYYVFSWLEQFGLSLMFRPFWDSLIHPNFKFWFLNNFTNIDGVKVSWSGIGVLYYYAYNIGLAFPILFVLILAKKITINLKWHNYWIYYLTLFLFFAIAEIFPRIGLFYLPDRAWLFVSIILLLFVPFLIKKFVSRYNLIVVKIVLIMILVISASATWYLTYAKQGEITQNEYAASQFIQTHLEKDAFILTQPDNSVMIKYFTNRIFVVPKSQDFFMGGWSGQELALINNLPDQISQKSLYLQKKKDSEQKISQIEKNIYDTKDSKTAEKLAKQLVAEIKKLQLLEQALTDIESQHIDRERSIYILYSNNKFNSLAGKRPFWRERNFYGANLEKFNDHSEFFTKIYDQNGIIIWKVKK